VRQLPVEVIDRDDIHHSNITGVEIRRIYCSSLCFRTHPGHCSRRRRSEDRKEHEDMRKWWPLTAICAGTAMLLIDITIVSVALPGMARALHTTFADLQWVVDVYALVLGALVLTIGSLADRFGRRKVYVLGLGLFAASSLTCGLAPSISVLIAARGVQGIGAAAMFASTMALIAASYEGRDRGVAFGIWGAVNGAASAAGPIVGGLLTTHFGWRWIFLVNLPVSVCAVALTLAVIRETRDPRPRRVDLPGMVTFTIAAGTLTYALVRGGWTSWPTVALLAVAAVAVVAFIATEHIRRDPMLDLSLLRRGPFTAILAAGALLSAAAWAAMVYQSLWLQSVLGLSPISAGLVLLPCSVAAFAASAVVGRVMHRASPRLLIGAGLLVIAAGSFSESFIRTPDTWLREIPGLILVGCGAGLTMAPLSATAMSAVPAERAGMAAGALSTFRQLGYAFGIAVLGDVFRSGLTHVAGPSLATPLSGGQAAEMMAKSGTLALLVRHAFASALDTTFAVAAALGVTAAALVFALVRPRPGNRAGGDPGPGGPAAWRPGALRAGAARTRRPTAGTALLSRRASATGTGRGTSRWMPGS
jgi:EmrB/QacA subfamily drug resistance transporter